jgi:hypothetical protein
MLCLLVPGYPLICGGKPFFRLVTFKIKYLIRKPVKLLTNFGKVVSLIWNTLKYGGVWQRLCYPSLKSENLVLKLVIVFLLVMLAITHAIDFLLLKVMF